MAVALHPHLEGTLAPIRSEDDFELRVSGRIPDGLEGAFYRNGPNPQFDPTGPLPPITTIFHDCPFGAWIRPGRIHLTLCPSHFTGQLWELRVVESLFAGSLPEAVLTSWCSLYVEA